MRFIAITLLAFLSRIALADAPATQPAFSDSLSCSGIITCPAEKIWNCFTTGEGIIQAWGVKIAKVDFRIGGVIRTSYDPKVDLNSDAAIRNTILAYVPGRFLVMQPGAPAEAPAWVKAFCESCWSTILLEPLAPDRTRVTVTCCGFKDTPELREAYKHFKAGDESTLEHMQKSLGDHELDGKIRKAFDLLKTLQGEWVCEGTSEDPKFRACAVWRSSLKSTLLNIHTWLGDTSGMRTEEDMSIFVDPSTGGLAFMSMFPTGAIARGHIRLLDDTLVAMNWDRDNGTGKSTPMYIELKVTDTDHYQVQAWPGTSASPDVKPVIDVAYTRVKEAPADFKIVK